MDTLYFIAVIAFPFMLYFMLKWFYTFMDNLEDQTTYNLIVAAVFILGFLIIFFGNND